MFLAIDVGNTSITLGLFDGKKLVKNWRAETLKTDSAQQLWKKIRIHSQNVDGIVIASVVPSLDKNLEKLCQKFFKQKPLWVNYKTAKMPLRVDKPKEVGADRLCNAVAAWRKYKRPTIIVDFGTATTFDVVTAKGEYGGGPITPGIAISSAALTSTTSKLPAVKIAKPKHVVGRNTVECIQSGLYYGYIGMVDYLLSRIQKEEDCKMKIIATGGLASLIAQESKWIESVEPHLTLEGLYYIHCGNNF